MSEAEQSPLLGEDKATTTVPAAPRRRGPKVDVELTRQRREDILREAAHLFDQVGYHGVNMEMIAAAAGLKKPTLYHYVKGKDEILFLMQQTVIASVREGIENRASAGADAKQILLGVYEDIFSKLRDAPGTVRSFFEHGRELTPEQQKVIAAERDLFNRRIVGVIRDGMDQGLIARGNPGLTALCYFGVVNWAYQWYNPERDSEPEIIARRCFEIILRGIEGDSGTPF